MWLHRTLFHRILRWWALISHLDFQGKSSCKTDLLKKIKNESWFVYCVWNNQREGRKGVTVTQWHNPPNPDSFCQQTGALDWDVNVIKRSHLWIPQPCQVNTRYCISPLSLVYFLSRLQAVAPAVENKAQTRGWVVIIVRLRVRYLVSRPVSGWQQGWLLCLLSPSSIPGEGGGGCCPLSSLWEFPPRVPHDCVEAAELAMMSQVSHHGVRIRENCLNIGL